MKKSELKKLVNNIVLKEQEKIESEIPAVEVPETPATELTTASAVGEPVEKGPKDIFSDKVTDPFKTIQLRPIKQYTAEDLKDKFIVPVSNLAGWITLPGDVNSFNEVLSKKSQVKDKILDFFIKGYDSEEANNVYKQLKGKYVPLAPKSMDSLWTNKAPAAGEDLDTGKYFNVFLWAWMSQIVSGERQAIISHKTLEKRLRELGIEITVNKAISLLFKNSDTRS